ncbi:DUF2752 domain-containing protein [Chryseobacterium sp. SIMBA_029]|uniref:DUF2752 domain-containing protein n=1 Tax=Chryseobacterium sp. SIMBA_029 TaxID=3085772 RepID=UPI003978E0EF
MKIEDFMLTCPSKKFLGIECFGCGAQRAIVMVLEGRFSEAFHLFPAVYTLLIFFGMVGVSFIDKKRKYGNALLLAAVFNVIFMIISYYYKYFHLGSY